MVGGLAITILCCVSAAAHCMLLRTLYRNGKWAPSAKPPKVLPAPGTLKSFADVAAVTGKGKRLKGQADGLACAPSGDSPSAAALASKFGAKFGAKFKRRKVRNEAAAPIAALSPASASESKPSGSPGFSHGFPKSADSCMSPASHSASKSSPTPPARGVGLTSGGWALLPGVRGAKAGRNPVEMVMKLRFEPVPTLDGMTIEEIIRLKEDHAALKLKLESERSEVESLLRAVRQYEATAGKFLSSPSMLSVLSSASLTTTLTVGTQGWRARSSAAAHSP